MCRAACPSATRPKCICFLPLGSSAGGLLLCLGQLLCFGELVAPELAACALGLLSCLEG